MLDSLLLLAKGKTAVALIVVVCGIILTLGCVGIISWTSPIEKVAEIVLKDETGFDFKPGS